MTTNRMISSTEVAVALLVLVGAGGIVRSQDRSQDVYVPAEAKYNSGQSLQPAFEGWTKNADGSYSMWFGYLNRNYKETPDIPPGPNNGFGAGGEDLGQPTHFLPRRQKFIFQVKVPADWPKDKDMVWTVNVNGTTLKAYGSLWPVWEIDEKIMSANNGGRTARLDGEPPNLAPKIAAALPDQTAVVGMPLTLTLAVSDDGMPQPSARRGGGANRAGGARGGAPDGTPAAGRGGRGGRGGDPDAFDPEADAGRTNLRVKWTQYRGAGTVTFKPAVAAVVGADGKPVGYVSEGAAAKSIEGKATTKVTFDKPGVYTLRGYAMDPDAFMDVKDVKVTVVGR